MDGPLVPKFADDIVNKIRDRIIAYFNNLDDDIIKVYDKPLFTELNWYLGEILKKFAPAKYFEITETLTLELAFKFFISKVVDKRVQGIGEMKTFIKDTMEDENKKGFQQKYLSTTPGRFFSIKYVNITIWNNKLFRSVIKWLEDKKFAENVFKDIHAEVIRQCKAIFMFLAHTRGLKQNEIDAIWKACVGKHEATQRLIYDFVINLMSILPLNNVNSFYELVETIPVKSIGVHTIEFIRDFTIEAAINMMKMKEKQKKW